jgi:hypothetical protein
MSKAALMFAGTLGGLYLLYEFIGLLDPESRRPTPVNNDYSYPWDPNADNEADRLASEESREALYEK